jgi:ABC-type transport system involved in cytochrome c biogenesis permease component
MDDFYIIFSNELKSLAKSTKATILSLVLVSLFWGLFLSYNIFDTRKSIIWIIVSAFVASSGFANVSFARERLAGSWEILLASGISRKTIFWAKFAFTQTATFFCGIITLAIAYSVMCVVFLLVPYYDLIFIDALLFFCTALSINALTAYFTIINVNMRAAQLINMFVVSVCITAIHYVCDMNDGVYAFELWTDWAKITAILLIPAIPFLFLCHRTLYNDKTTLPIVY